jgi:hypothetical protein
MIGTATFSVYCGHYSQSIHSYTTLILQSKSAVCYNYIQQYVGKLLLLDENKFVKSAFAFIATIISVYTFKTLNLPLVVKLFPAPPNNRCVYYMICGVECVPQFCLFSSLHGQYFRNRWGRLLYVQSYVMQWHKYVYFGILGASKHNLVNKKKMTKVTAVTVLNMK